MPWISGNYWLNQSQMENNAKLVHGFFIQRGWTMENGLQWIKTSKYAVSFKDFAKSTSTPEYLAQVWLYNYERPADLDQPQRSTQARAWYNFLSGEPGGTLPAWLLFKFSGRGLK